MPARAGREDRLSTTPLLEVKGVTLQYKTQILLSRRPIASTLKSFRVDRFILLGPSGCGKSTLLKAVGGYMTPTEGEMQLKGKLIKHPGPDRMMVFQEFDQLLPWKTVKQNVMFPLLCTHKFGVREAEDRGDALYPQGQSRKIRR